MNRDLSAPRLCTLMAACMGILLLAAGTGAQATLNAPQNLEITASSSTLQVDWNVVQDPQVGGYLVYYDTDGPEAPFNGTGAVEGDSPIRVAGASSNTLTLHGLAPDTRYFFAVSAYDLTERPGDPSRPSPGALCDVLNPAAPTGLQVTVDVDGLHLSWTANTEVDALGTTIYRGSSPQPTDSIAFVDLPNAAFDEAAPGYNQTYYYRLKAMDFCRLTSNFSEDVVIAVPPLLSRSDVDASGEVNISDPIYNLYYLFEGGPAPPCLESADDNDTGDITVDDPIYSLNYQFAQGPPPPAPFPACGIDPTVDALGCLSFAPCGTGPGGPPQPGGGSDVLSVQQASIDGDAVTYNLIVGSGSPLVGLEGTVSYPSDRMTFVGLERTDYTREWDFLSAKADPGEGTIHVGGVPDYRLQNPILPQGEVAAVLRFVLRDGDADLRVQDGRFVLQGGSAIDPTLDGSSAIPGHGRAALQPSLTAPNPYRPGATIRLAGPVGHPAEVSLFTVKGERVRVLYRGAWDRTDKVLSWDGRLESGLAAGPGMYYLRARLGDSTLSRKILFLP